MVDVYTKKELDPEKRAASDLEFIIKDEQESLEPEIEMTSIDEERDSARVTAEFERTSARLLIFTTNPSALVPDSDLHQRLSDISTIFAEVHVVILNKLRDGVPEILRPTNNLWLYPTNSRGYWSRLDDAKEITSEQFEFAGGFRADVIIALDAFEAGVVALSMAKKYNRLLQVHITHDIFDHNYLKNQKNSFVKKLMAWWVFRSRPSVRASTRAIAKSILEHYPYLENNLEIVPQHIDLSQIATAQKTGVLAERFPQYSFIILFVGPLTHDSGAVEALMAAAGLLQYPSIALIYLGEGDARKEIESRAKAMGALEQIIISPRDIDEIAAMKEAHLLIFPDGKDADERVLLKAAAAGLPILTAYSDFVNELFTDGESAFICPAGDIRCMQMKANIILNENVYRKKFARNAKEDVLERVEQNVDEYKLAFKDSVERVLYSFETPGPQEEVIQEQEMPARN